MSGRRKADAHVEPLLVDGDALRAFGQVSASPPRAGRMPSARAYDAVPAAIALSYDPLSL
jgi:hypothetical protein